MEIIKPYLKIKGKSFYRDPKTKEKIAIVERQSVGVYDLKINVPKAINQTIVIS